MVKKATYFVTSRGTAHKTEWEAWEAELTILLAESKGVNEGQAANLAKYIFKRSSDFKNILNHFSEVEPE